MNWELAYQIALGVGLVIIGAWAFDARRLMGRAARLVALHDQPTEEIRLPPTTRVGRLEDLGGPARPMPPDWYNLQKPNRPDPWPL